MGKDNCLQERIETVQAMAAHYASRLLAIDTSSAVLDHAERIEDHAKELLAKAHSIRVNLMIDTIRRDEILHEWYRAQVELSVLEWLRANGMRYSSMVVDRMVDIHLKSKGL